MITAKERYFNFTWIKLGISGIEAQGAFRLVHCGMPTNSYVKKAIQDYHGVKNITILGVNEFKNKTDYLTFYEIKNTENTPKENIAKK